MAYRRPFTPLQRSELKAALSSYRRHHRKLSRKYVPTNEAQRRVLAEYGDAISEMMAEFEKTDRRVRVESLNRSDIWAKLLAVEYLRLKSIES